MTQEQQGRRGTRLDKGNIAKVEDGYKTEEFPYSLGINYCGIRQSQENLISGEYQGNQKG